MREDIKLVLATRDDAELIHQMKYEAFLPLYEKYHDDETSPVKETLEKVIMKLEQETTDYYLIRYQGENVGAVRVCERQENVFYISPIFILPAYQNRGIAHTVIQLLFEKYRRAVTWRLDTILQEKGNCHLYEKCGFVRVGEEKKVNEKMTLIDYERLVMRIKIIGSGGCVSTPRPCCNCRVCKEAREKGFPYARTGCSLYIEDIKTLIDTPEDINYALNNANVSEIKSVLYSHADPDHTMGMRVFEQLRMDWLGLSVGKKNNNPIGVYALPTVIEELKGQGTFRGSVLGYYEYCGLVTVHTGYCVESENIRINLIPVDEKEEVAIFVIMQEDKKVIYAPCDMKPFPDNSMFQNADILIIGNTIVGDALKDGFVLAQDNPLRDELFVMDEIVAIKEKYNIKKVIVTHLEEDWGKSYDDYVELEKEYDGIMFAYDGMEVVL